MKPLSIEEEAPSEEGFIVVAEADLSLQSSGLIIGVFNEKETAEECIRKQKALPFFVPDMKIVTEKIR